jgi:hypothetical protein
VVVPSATLALQAQTNPLPVKRIVTLFQRVGLPLKEVFELVLAQQEPFSPLLVERFALLARQVFFQQVVLRGAGHAQRVHLITVKAHQAANAALHTPLHRASETQIASVAQQELGAILGQLPALVAVVCVAVGWRKCLIQFLLLLDGMGSLEVII